MRNKWILVLMLLAMLATPVLACGFPLPAGTSMMAISKAVCAADESADSCQVRQDAYQMMGKLQAASIEEMAMSLYIDDGGTVTTAEITGGFTYVVADESEYLGADVHAFLDEATVTSGFMSDDLSGSEFIIIGNTGYTSEDGGETWIEEELDPTSLLGLSFILGLAGAQGSGLDLFGHPDVFSVTMGEPTELDGQEMIVQTLTIDLPALLSNSEALIELFNAASEMGLEDQGINLDDLGDPSQLAMMAAMLLPFFEGTEFSSTIWIGADDGYIHYIDETYDFRMDMSAMDPTTPPMQMSYFLSGYITDHDAPLAVTAPSDAEEGSGLGGSGLGGSLFGN